MADDDSIDQLVAGDEDALREQAVRRLKKRRDFHSHLFMYLLINVMLWGIWLAIAVTTDSWYPWPVWVTLGWGIGLVANAWDVYLRHPIAEHEIREEMERLGRHR